MFYFLTFDHPNDNPDNLTPFHIKAPGAWEECAIQVDPDQFLAYDLGNELPRGDDVLVRFFHQKSVDSRWAGAGYRQCHRGRWFQSPRCCYITRIPIPNKCF